jgi:LacI family transcriptional regulator
MALQMPRVLLLLDTSISPGREALRGIARYLREHDNWSCYVAPGTAEALPPGVERWRGSGAIATVKSAAVAEELSRLGVPTVNIYNGLSELAMPSVQADDEAVGRIAAQHFLDRGFENFAYLGFPDHRFSVQRRAGYERRLSQEGHACHSYWPDVRPVNWQTHRAAVEHWIRSLPKPAAVLACHDVQGRTLLEAARRVGVPVPEELAVLGVDNDDALCELALPPLSSVDPAGDIRGYRAAALLDGLMRGEAPPEAPVLVEPRSVVTRASTDVLAVEDREVAAALQFIRENAHRAITVRDVLAEVPISRRSLEWRFRQVLGRLPGEEIRRVRLRKARQLLAGTDLLMGEVARRSGFRSAKSLSDVFSRHTGLTPSEYRTRFSRR